MSKNNIEVNCYYGTEEFEKLMKKIVNQKLEIFNIKKNNNSINNHEITNNFEEYKR